MNVLFAIKSMTVEGGGAEKVLAAVANGLVARTHRVGVLTFDHPGPSFFQLAPTIQRYEMACNTPGTPTNPLAFLRAVPRIRRTVREFRPDVVIGFMHSMYVPLYFAMYGIHIPMIASEHTEARHYQGRPLQRVLRRLPERSAVFRTVASVQARQSFLDSNGGDSMVIHNPISLLAFTAGRSTQPSTPPSILTLGSFRAEKDHATLLTAFAEVAPEFPDWRLRLVGDGALRPRLEAQRAALRLEDRVEMPGFTRDVAAAYAGARFLVLPSRYESFGLVAAEALASGRAVLGFDDCAGLREIVSDGVNGLLVPGVSDSTARASHLAAGLRRLMADPDLCDRLGAAGPAAVTRFDLDAVLDRWEEVIGMAVQPQGQSSRPSGRP
ncbi:MAG: glycosyltransferase [Paracoccaceae bacterium]